MMEQLFYHFLLVFFGPGKSNPDILLHGHVRKQRIVLKKITNFPFLWLQKNIFSGIIGDYDVYRKFISNLIAVLAGKNIGLSRKINDITPKTIRERLISYLSSQAVKQESNYITIPFNRQQLADYLCVDRSAMSNELSKMRRDGLLTFDRNMFKLNLSAFMDK